jgi:hypothetical protein
MPRRSSFFECAGSDQSAKRETRCPVHRGGARTQQVGQQPGRTPPVHHLRDHGGPAPSRNVHEECRAPDDTAPDDTAPRRPRSGWDIRSGEYRVEGGGELGNPEIDPLMVELVRADMDAADTAEAAFARTGDLDQLHAAGQAWLRMVRTPQLRAAFPGLRAALRNNAAGTLLRRYWELGDAGAPRRFESRRGGGCNGTNAERA